MMRIRGGGALERFSKRKIFLAQPPARVHWLECWPFCFCTDPIPSHPHQHHSCPAVIQTAVEKVVVIANVTVSIAVGGIKALSRVLRGGECDEASYPDPELLLKNRPTPPRFPPGLLPRLEPEQSKGGGLMAHACAGEGDGWLTNCEGFGCAGRRKSEKDAGDVAKYKLSEELKGKEGERAKQPQKEANARKDSEGIMFSAGKGSKGSEVRKEMIRTRMREQEAVSTAAMRARAEEKQRKEKEEAARSEKDRKG